MKREEIAKHNLRHALKAADTKSAVAKAAQEIFESGHELEDLFKGAMFDVMANKVVWSGWAPKLSDEKVAEIEDGEP